MVINWSPEPSKSKDDWLSTNNSFTIVLDDESDDDNLFSFFGYQLLPHDTNNEFSQETHLESDSDSNESQELAQGGELHSDTFHKPVVSEQLQRHDIVINLDEVRQAMNNVTLPESAIPPWANQIPESQWTSFLLSRITSMQNNNPTA